MNIRLTVRFVDKTLSFRRRPFATRSKQCKISGRVLSEAIEDAEKTMILKQWASPLIRSLIASSDIDLTRMNLAVTNFADLDVNQSPKTTGPVTRKRAIQPAAHTSQSSRINIQQKASKKLTTTRIEHFFAKKS
jgi:hypothetical protein